MKEIITDPKYIGILIAGAIIGSHYIRKAIKKAKQQHGIKKAGRQGENEVSKQLKSLDRKRFKRIDNMLIKFKKGGSTQLDHVLVTPGGIIAIETKNFNGQIIGDIKQRNWTQVNNNGRNSKRHEFYSPVMQNDGHVKAINYILSRKHDVPVYSMIAFSPKADLSKIRGSRRDLRIVDFENMNREVLNISKKRVMDDSQIKEVYKLLKSEDSSGIIEDMKHVQNVKKMR